MIPLSPISATDLVSLLLDAADEGPCLDESVLCYFRTLVDWLLLGVLAFAVLAALGFVLAISLSIVAARAERQREHVRAPRKRILSGPVHTDGVWVRLVEDERGRRLVEVLDRGDWTSTTRDLSQFALDVPRTLP